MDWDPVKVCSAGPGAAAYINIVCGYATRSTAECGAPAATTRRHRPRWSVENLHRVRVQGITLKLNRGWSVSVFVYT
jgi:hypothetical protein